MSATIIGLSSIFTTRLSHTQNSDRSVIVTWIQKVSANSIFSAPVIGTIYVYLGVNVAVVNVTVDRTSGEFVEVTARLEGAGSSASASPYQQESIGSLSEEPIQTHPNFPAILAVATDAGATFDDNNNFVGFNSNAGGNLVGVQSYLSPTISYRRSYTTNTTPSLVNVGRYFASGAYSDFPDLPSGANWLLTSISFTSKSGVINVNEDYRASDSNGWNEYIYRSA